MDAALTAVIAGAVGAGITGLLQLQRDRIEALRKRRLDAADEFATAAADVFIQLTSKFEQLPNVQQNPQARLDGLTRAIADARTDIHALTGRLPRIELLFGVKSPAGGAATDTVRHLLLMTSEMEKPNADGNVIDREYRAAADASGLFHQKAFDAFGGRPWWQQWWAERGK